MSVTAEAGPDADTDIALTALGAVGGRVHADNRQVDVGLPDATLSDAPGALLLRRFRPEAPSEDAVREVVGRRAVLRPGRRSGLDDISRWPVRLVVGEPSAGVVMPAVPEQFLQPTRLPSGASRPVPRTLSQVMLTPQRASRLGLLTPDVATRIGISRALAEAVAVVHRAGGGTGPLDGEHVLFRVRPEPAVLLCGCATPTRTTPEDDRQALGLLVLRVLATPPHAWATRDPQRARAALGTAGVDLVRAAVEGTPDGRPSPDDWVALLRDVPGGEDRPAVLDEAVPDRTLVPPGDPLTVTWSARWADEVWIQAPGVEPVRAAGTTHGETEIVPQRSGTVTLRLVNRAGVGDWTIGRVVVVGLPTWSDLPVPMPHLHLPTVGLPEFPRKVAVLPDLPAEASPAAWDARALAFEPPPLPTPLPQLAPEVRNPPGFDVGATSFPIDVASIMSAAPTLTPRRKWRFR